MKLLPKRGPRLGQGSRNVPLFWVVLRAFMLVIVLGVCGMLGFFGVAIGRDDAAMPGHEEAQRIEDAYGATLANYYVAQGNSWRGIDEYLHDLLLADPFHFPIAAVLDGQGKVVASEDERFRVGQRVAPVGFIYRVPLRVEGRRVGTMVLSEPGPGSMRRGPPPVFWSLLRGLLAAGLGLGLILLVLAVVFARRLSRPLRNLTLAAQTLAAGQLDVQVPAAAIREVNELATAFNTMARALAEADRQRRQMTADVAHELRTPLSVIKGRLEGLQDGVYEATPEQIGRLLDEMALLERLIEDLRLLALAEAGQLRLYPELVDACGLLEDIVATFADQAAAQEIGLHIVAPDDLPAIYVDPQRITQVLANLVTNALRHTPAGGSITLVGEEAQGNPAHNGCQVVLRVRDTGQGIAPDDLPHIFDRFWRADRARTRSGGGSGLGLAIARQIVLAHRGSIAVASTQGQGTTMSIALPCGDEQSSA